jgi:hypothetical protein
MADDNNRKRSNIGGLIAAAILLILIVWLVHALSANLKEQKCEMEGRRDCIPLPQPDSN